MNNFEINVLYEFEFKDGEQRDFFVRGSAVHHDFKKEGNFPSWTLLDHLKCKHCTLTNEETRFCPAALSLLDIVESFVNVKSIEKVKCTVTHNAAKTTVEKPMQEVLYSLIGLKLATSGCPYLEQLKPMAFFHEPFSNDLYTTYRVLGFHFVKEYLLKLQDKNHEIDVELKKLVELYQNVNLVNSYLANRVRSIKINDATPNSLVLLDLFAITITTLIDDNIEYLKSLYKVGK